MKLTNRFIYIFCVCVCVLATLSNPAFGDEKEPRRGCGSILAELLWRGVSSKLGVGLLGAGVGGVGSFAYIKWQIRNKLDELTHKESLTDNGDSFEGEGNEVSASILHQRVEQYKRILAKYPQGLRMSLYRMADLNGIDGKTEPQPYAPIYWVLEKKIENNFVADFVRSQVIEGVKKRIIDSNEIFDSESDLNFTKADWFKKTKAIPILLSEMTIKSVPGTEKVDIVVSIMPKLHLHSKHQYQLSDLLSGKEQEIQFNDEGYGFNDPKGKYMGELKVRAHTKVRYVYPKGQTPYFRIYGGNYDVDLNIEVEPHPPLIAEKMKLPFKEKLTNLELRTIELKKTMLFEIFPVMSLEEQKKVTNKN